MRYHFAIAAAALWAGTALADEPAACYIAKDSTGDFVPGRMRPFDADPKTGAQIRDLLKQDSRANAKCLQRHVDHEGGWPQGAAILYGLRISPAGKLTQVSVLSAIGNDDPMLKACIARSICRWEFEVDTGGQDRLVGLRYVLPTVRRVHLY